MNTINTQRLLEEYVDLFNRQDEENVVQAIPNAAALDWLGSHIPRVSLPDPAIERTYYFRWWTYRKHLKRTPEGFVITEFHPDVSWAGKYNTIPCAAGHHVREGRWLRDNAFLDDYIHFWYQDGGEHLRSYSNWLESAVEALAILRGDDTGLDLTDAFANNLRMWENRQLGDQGLFWSSDNRDGSEFSVSGPGLRPTMNCYQYANRMAVAGFARRSGNAALAEDMDKQARALRQKINTLLWNEEMRFYVALPQSQTHASPNPSPLRQVRELFGYLPWMFGVAEPGRSDAFRQLLDPEGFRGAYGPTTAERRHPCFGLFYTGDALNAWNASRGDPPTGPLGHECLWNGPSWPFATSMMLTALANLLATGEEQQNIHSIDYIMLLSQYAASHIRHLEHGGCVSWIDENLHPDTGDWISRTRLMNWGGERFPKSKGGYERGKDYNHSCFCDLVLEGLFGVRPDWEALSVTPLFPAEWPYAVLEDVSVHGQNLCVYYRKQEGYQVLLNGKIVYSAATPSPCRIPW